jgi:regulator of protease activity HflC (stomatin/prohibitin superfamily)
VVINIKAMAEKKFDLINNPVHWLGGPAILIILDGVGLYLQRGNQFSRTLGPGIAFLDRFETVRDIIDLRHQTIRSGDMVTPPISARTKDGIKIFLNAEATFQIIRPIPQKKQPDNLIKFSAKNNRAEKKTKDLFHISAAVDSGDFEAIRKAYESTTVRYTRNGTDRKYFEAKFREGVWGTVSGDLAKYITMHFLDELLVFDVTDGNSGNAEQISNSLKCGQLLSWQEREKLRQGMDKTLRTTRGVTLTDLRIVDFELPKEVNEQRLKMLEVERKCNIARIEGRSAAKSFIHREEARIRGQQDLIASFADKLGGVSPENFSDSVLLSLSSFLSQSMEDPILLAYMANNTLETLKQLNEFLSQSDGDSANTAGGNIFDE